MKKSDKENKNYSAPDSVQNFLMMQKSEIVYNCFSAAAKTIRVYKKA